MDRSQLSTETGFCKRAHISRTHPKALSVSGSFFIFSETFIQVGAIFSSWAWRERWSTGEEPARGSIRVNRRINCRGSRPAPQTRWIPSEGASSRGDQEGLQAAAAGRSHLVNDHRRVADWVDVQHRAFLRRIELSDDVLVLSGLDVEEGEGGWVSVPRQVRQGIHEDVVGLRHQDVATRFRSLCSEFRPVRRASSPAFCRRKKEKKKKGREIHGAGDSLFLDRSVLQPLYKRPWPVEHNIALRTKNREEAGENWEIESGSRPTRESPL